MVEAQDIQVQISYVLKYIVRIVPEIISTINFRFKAPTFENVVYNSNIKNKENLLPVW